MFFFKRRKKEKELEKKFEEIGNSIAVEPKEESLAQKQEFTVEQLEQMIETTREIEDTKAEYRVVTSYLNDIQTIEALSEEKKKPIEEAASNIAALNKARAELLNAEKKITDAQFNQMQQEEANIPNAIKRLRSNEEYLTVIKKDLKYLDREKSEWQLCEEMLSQDEEKMRKLLLFMAAVSVAAVGALFVVQLMLGKSMKLAWTVLLFAAAAGICIPYIKILNDQTEAKRAKANTNKAISLQNKVKYKYVNMANAVDYACEKYHVKDSKELEYVWTCYMDAVKQKEKFEQNSEDLEYFRGRLVRELSKYRLYDAKVWIPQAAALLDHKEMVEITHSLMTRRQKLRSRIEYNADILRQQKDEVENFIKENPQMAPQVEQILRSAEKLVKVQPNAGERMFAIQEEK